MPKLIKNVSTNVIESLNDNINLNNSVEGDFGYKDYFKIGNVEFFIQNYKKVIESENLNKAKDFGLAINSDKTFKELEISY